MNKFEITGKLYHQFIYKEIKFNNTTVLLI